MSAWSEQIFKPPDSLSSSAISQLNKRSFFFLFHFISLFSVRFTLWKVVSLFFTFFFTKILSCFFTSIFILFYFLLLFFPSLPSFLFYYILSYFFFCLFFFPFFFFSYPFSVFFSFFPSIHWNCRTRNHFLIEVREVIHNNKTCQSSPSKLNYPRFSFLLSFSVPPYQFSSSFLNSAYFSLLNYYTSSPPPRKRHFDLFLYTKNLVMPRANAFSQQGIL